ncbi:MAG: hypothetical protein JSV96_17010 [Candidatus Aminicenantes bacterium]|nr:MAG: hypothetical protein JSV96_17010 [Candidatus Aminicenantes bacterium]
MRRLIVSAIGLILFSATVNAGQYRIGISGSYFHPSEKAFRNIYGTGIIFGLDVSRHIWKDMELHLEVRYYSKKGQLTFTRERTRIKLIPLIVSTRYTFLKRKINLYAGGGLTLNFFRENNPIGRVKESKLGFAVKIGALKRIKGFKKIIKIFIIDAYINYHYCKMKPAEIKFDAGGIDFGIALGTEF